MCKFIKIVLFTLLLCLFSLSSAQENKCGLSQSKSYFYLEKIIVGSALKFGITEPEINVLPTKEGTAQATIIYKSNEGKVIFNKDELENASNGVVSNETQKKIAETISQLIPPIKPPLTPSI